MPGRYQQILRRLRLLLACLVLTVVFEPPTGRLLLAESAVAIAGSLDPAPRSVATGQMAPRPARAECAPAARSEARPLRAPRLLGALAQSAPALDGRYLYLAHCALLC